jgi:hypothetical protein
MRHLKGSSGRRAPTSIGATTRARQARQVAEGDTPAVCNDQRSRAARGSSDRRPLHPRTLNAADDAWVEVLAVIEELREPRLSDERRQIILKSLAERWRSFLTRSEPIARLLEASAIGDSAVGAPKSGGAGSNGG